MIKLSSDFHKIFVSVISWGTSNYVLPNFDQNVKFENHKWEPKKDNSTEMKLQESCKIN